MRYIARDRDGQLYIHGSRPYRTEEQTWESASWKVEASSNQKQDYLWLKWQNDSEEIGDDD